MKFLTWMKRNRLTISSFSRTHNMSKATVHRLVKRKGTPSGGTIYRVEYITDGEVTAKDMMPRSEN